MKTRRTEQQAVRNASVRNSEPTTRRGERATIRRVVVKYCDTNTTNTDVMMRCFHFTPPRVARVRVINRVTVPSGARWKTIRRRRTRFSSLRARRPRHPPRTREQKVSPLAAAARRDASRRSPRWDPPARGSQQPRHRGFVLRHNPEVKLRSLKPRTRVIPLLLLLRSRRRRRRRRRRRCPRRSPRTRGSRRARSAATGPPRGDRRSSRTRNRHPRRARRASAAGGAQENRLRNDVVAGFLVVVVAGFLEERSHRVGEAHVDPPPRVGRRRRRRRGKRRVRRGIAVPRRRRRGVVSSGLLG